MVPHSAPTRVLELLSDNNDIESILTAATLTILFILASAFDMSFRIVSTMVLIPILPSTRLLISLAFCATRFVLLSAHCTVHDLWLAVTSSSLSQAVVDVIPVLLLLLLTILAIWNALSSFYPYNIPDTTAPSSPNPPSGRFPMSFRPARGLPVLKLPSDHTPTPCSERERRYLEIIAARDATIARRAKRVEKLMLSLDKAKEAIAAREQTILENAGVTVQKDATIVRLSEDVEHLRSDNANVRSTLTQKATHISELDLKLEAARSAAQWREAAVGALQARMAMLEADLSTVRAEAVTLRAAASEKIALLREAALARAKEECFAQQAAIVVQKDELIASLQADILKLQRDLDSSHCRIVEKEAFLAVQASTLDDLQFERDAAARSAQAQAQLNAKVEAYEQEAADRSLVERHLPPVDDLETCDAATNADVLSLTQQLAAARQEALDATRLQKAYEEVADAGAVRVIELVEKLDEQKELSEVDRELFLARIRKLTALVDTARSGFLVPEKAFAQLRLPTSTSGARAEDSFTAVTPRLPASSKPASPPPPLTKSGRKLRRRSAIENLRQPLADVTSSATANSAAPTRQPAPRSRLPRSWSMSTANPQSPPALHNSILS
ncbi:hypothetical protein LXA43DRAFT_553579 [Ganoderma leucocontextum]|nr:hypothetical protein LXA43DRAFT_553579 [Ganoderma leucocontextum]